MLNLVDELQDFHVHINWLCFDGLLPSCPIAVGKSKYSKGKLYGEYYPNGYGVGLILIDPTCAASVLDMHRTMAHEMIHQWQDLFHMPINHGYMFQAWRAHITELTGLIP